MEKMHDFIVAVLSAPLVMYTYVLHVYESVRSHSEAYHDKLFMKRFNLLDGRHVEDLIKWNQKYHEDRKKEVDCE